MKGGFGGGILRGVNVLCDGSAVGGELFLWSVVIIMVVLRAWSNVLCCVGEELLRGVSWGNGVGTIEAMTHFLRNRQFQIRDALVETYMIGEWSLVVLS
jgi:hypothetical protein